MSEAIGSASEQVAATANALSQTSSELASSVEQTSASVEEMTATVSQNADNAKVTENISTGQPAAPPKAARRSARWYTP